MFSKPHIYVYFVLIFIRVQLKKSLNLLKFGHRPKKRRVFQLFSVRVEFESDKQGELYGFVGLSNWSDRDDYDDVVFFFDREDNDTTRPHPILNRGFVSLTDPFKPYRSFSSCNVEIPMELSVSTEDKKFEVINLDLRLDLSKDQIKNSLNICKRTVKRKSDSSVTLNYIILDRAVDATVEVLFKNHNGRSAVHAYGKILAYYDYFCYSCASHEVDHYKTTLFEANKSCPASLETGKFPLARSMLAVPWGFPLVIDVKLTRVDDNEEILVRTFKFRTKLKDSSSTGCIEGTDCTMELKVNWKCEEGTT